MSRTIHCCLDVRGALKSMNQRQLVDLFRHDSGRKATADEAKEHLMDAIAKGYEVLPFGSPCEGFSYQTGCPGHEEVNHG